MIRSRLNPAMPFALAGCSTPGRMNSMATKNPTVSFDTELAAFGNNTGIVVPPEAIEALGGGKRPPVDVNVNGYGYRSTVAVMGGQSLISVNADTRKATGLSGGDPISVTLTLNEAPREVEVPPEFAAALQAQPEAETFFAGLSNSLQRYHADQVAGAKTDETRQRRIDKAIALFLDGKKR